MNTLTSMREPVLEAARFIQKQINTPPLVGLVCGTGLAEIADVFSPMWTVPYRDIPNFCTPTVAGHSGLALFGKISQTPIIAMQGRFHLYEGYTPLQITFPIRVMQELGVRYLILTNASGGLAAEFSSGDIMVITDHINLTGTNTLCGPNESTWGIRFPDMSRAYDSALITRAVETADAAGAPVQKGVYAGLRGPSLETPAEVRYLKIIGADAVGFSTVQETIVAVHANMKVLGLSLITNVHRPESKETITLESVLSVARAASSKLTSLIRDILEKIDDIDTG